MGYINAVQSLSPWKGVSLFLLTIALIKLLQGIFRYKKFFQFYNRLCGETDFHILWGNLHKLAKDPEDRMKYSNNMMLKHPKYFRMWAGPFRPVTILHHPDTVKVLLKTAEPKPMVGSYRYGTPWLGEGLLIASGQRWARSRRLLTPAFHFDILKPYMDVYNTSADVLLNKIGRYAESGESLELFSLISLCTLEIIMKCAMSYEEDIQIKGESHPYVRAVKELTEIWFDRGRNPLLFSDFTFNCTKIGRTFHNQCDYVHGVSEEIIETRRKTLEKSGPSQKKYLDFLDILLTARDEKGDGMTPLEIRNEVDTFLFEGHDTTASAISWILYSLSTHSEIQDKVQEEVDAILDGKDNDTIDWSDLSEMPYLTCVIKEGMRMHCPVPFIMRQVLQDTVIDGVKFPKDSIFSISLLNLHHNPEVWEDPWEFRPERFLPENIKEKDNYAFVPFSAGPRNCIGQHFAMNEEKVILARIVRRFRLTADPEHPVKRRPAAVMRSETGIRVFATHRGDHST